MKDYYDFELLTPCLCHGASKTTAEMRIPSIRGHLRRWHTILFGSEDMKLTWGTASGKVISSRVILRLLPINNAPESQMPQQVLPHVKVGPKAFTCSALKRGTRYRLLVAFRPMTSEQVRERVDRVITSWLYLGCVGMRSSRAFGSVWPQEAKPDRAGFCKAVETAAEKLEIMVSAKPLSELNLAICTDTLSGGTNERYFGYVKGRNRLTSPLKMKYIRLSDGFHLVLYATSEEIVSRALEQLDNAGKPLGKIKFTRISDGRPL